MTDRAIEIWTEALGDVLAFCIPSEIREQVLRALLEEQKERGTTAKPFKLGKLDPEKYHAKKEARSLMIQVMTRSITNNISKEDAAKVLFRRQGRGGTGSRWLPDYLDGLPGIEVDKKKCADIADTAGPSRLREAMTNER